MEVETAETQPMNLDIKFPINKNEATNQEVTELANMLQYHLKVPLTRDMEMDDYDRYGLLNGLMMTHLHPNVMGALHTVLKYYQDQKPYYKLVVQDGNNLHDFSKLPLEEFKSVASRAGASLNMAIRQRESTS